METLTVLASLMDNVWGQREAAEAQRRKASFWSGDRNELDGQIEAYRQVLNLLSETRAKTMKELAARQAISQNLMDTSL